MSDTIPTPPATTDRPPYDPPRLYYVWVFIGDDFQPIGAFNTRAEADDHLDTVHAWFKNNGHVRAPAAVTHYTWPEFLWNSRSPLVSRPEGT